MRQKLYWSVPFLLFILLSLFLAKGLTLEPQKLASKQEGHVLPEFDLPVLNHPDLHFKSNQLTAKVALLNFWASWCSSCAEEQLFLMNLAEQGLRIYGINYKDPNPNDAKNWLKEWGNPYRTIGVDSSGDTAIDFGVYGTPETFLLYDGVIIYRYAGVLDEQAWQREFQPRLDELRTKQ